MKENTRFFTSSVLTKIIRSCLWMGILGFFAHSCVAADDDGRPSEHFCPTTCQVMDPHTQFSHGEIYHLLEEREKTITAKTKEAEQLRTEMEALKGKLEQYQREAGEHIEELKKQLAASQEEVETLRIKTLETDRRVSEDKRLEKKEEKCPVAIIPAIPLVAQGYEAIYRKFLNGVLIYTDPKTNNKITLLIRDLHSPNPLESAFDLSRCGDTGKYLSIATGYRKGYKRENDDKFEIWFAPRFLIEKELKGQQRISKDVMREWKNAAAVGMFWTWGNWASDDYDIDYLTTESMDSLSKINLYKSYKKATHVGVGRSGFWWGDGGALHPYRAMSRDFHILFMN